MGAKRYEPAGIYTLRMGQFYTRKDFSKAHWDLLKACHHQGSCDADVDAALPFFEIDKPDELREYLSHFTDWDASDDVTNLQRLLWIMAGDFAENKEAYLGE